MYQRRHKNYVLTILSKTVFKREKVNFKNESSNCYICPTNIILQIIKVYKSTHMDSLGYTINGHSHLGLGVLNFIVVLILKGLLNELYQDV